MYFGDYGLRKTCLDKCLEGHVSQDPLMSNMVTSLKDSWSLQNSFFIIFIDHCEVVINCRLRKTCLDKCLKGLVSQDLSTTNMVNRPKHSCNLHDSTFIIFYWSLRSKMCWKKSLLVIYNILGQLVNMLTTDDKYYLLKGDNLTEPIQMQLSKIKVFSNVLKSRSNFQHFEKKDDPQSLCTSAVADCKTRG